MWRQFLFMYKNVDKQINIYSDFSLIYKEENTFDDLIISKQNLYKNYINGTHAQYSSISTRFIPWMKNKKEFIFFFVKGCQ